MALNSRTISFLQLVTEADPNFYQERNRPRQYVFSNGRVFYWPPLSTLYSEFAINDQDQAIVDDQGNMIELT